MTSYPKEQTFLDESRDKSGRHIGSPQGASLRSDHWRGLILVALVLGVAWINLSRLATAEINQDLARSAPMVGFLAPDFILTTTDGERIQLSALRGQPVVLNFWATWCPPCRAEMSALETLWQSNKSADLLVIGVDQGENAATVERFAQGIVNTTFPLLLDMRREVGAEYGVRALPTTVFIDAEGRIRDIKVGGPLNLASLSGAVDLITH